jgi:DNA helicase-2/ATP-dependent DNA helicase PcrA
MEVKLDGLNEQQRYSVTSNASVLQILAPPGSGKTKTLTTRVAYLIAHFGLKPWNIIVCTFTKKAAKEMEDRIQLIFGEHMESRGLKLGTFHHVALTYLRRDGKHIGLPEKFSIADQSDTIAILRRLIKRYRYNFEPAKAQKRISRRKSGGFIEPTRSKSNTEAQEFDELFAKYEDELKAENLLDFDDVLLRCVDLLRAYPACVSDIEAVLVDEFQDTNAVQYDLMNLFAQHRPLKSGQLGPSPSITIVGDPDQSIYAFRAAEIKNLREMRRKYRDTHVVNLEENYRSAGAILKTSLKVIEQDSSREGIRMQATHCFGQPPVLRELPDAGIEAKWIVKETKRLKAWSGSLLEYSDFAILVRSSHLSRQVENELVKNGINYRMVGGHKFFERHEIKVLLDYLRVIDLPEHTEALLRVINVPPRDIGEVVIKSLLETAERMKWSLWKVIEKFAIGNCKVEKVHARAEKGLISLRNIINSARKKLTSMDFAEGALGAVLEHMVESLQFKEYLSKKDSTRADKDDGDGRWANVKELIAQASSFTIAGTANFDEHQAETDDSFRDDGSSPEDSLNQFLSNVALSAAVDAPESDGERVQPLTISTIHAAKGLEWPVVFIPAVYNGSIPHSRSELVDEERRLLYVGMTRAQGLLYLSYPLLDSMKSSTEKSPFIAEDGMASYFSKAGPKVTFPVVQDLSRILRRPCPAESELCPTEPVDFEDDLQWMGNATMGFQTANRMSMNHQYLATGQQFTRTTHPSTTSYQSNTATGVQYHRTGFTSASSTLNHPCGHPAVIMPMMGQSSGFVSASAHKRQLDDLAVTEVPRAEKQGLKRAKMLKVKPAQVPKGSILSFFGRPGSQRVEVMAAPNDSIRILQPMATVLPEVILKRQPSNVKVSLPDFPLHRPKTTRGPQFKKQVFDDEENRAVPKHTLFLDSSSPMRETSGAKCDDGPLLVEEQKEISMHNASHVLKDSNLTGTGSQRRTLGIRRSINGWAEAQNRKSSGGGS